MNKTDEAVPTPAVKRRAGPRQIGPVSFIGIAATVFLGLGLVWWAVTSAGLIEPLFLPAPGQVWTALRAQAANGQLWGDARVSTLRVFGGFVLAAVMAVPIGVLMGRYRVVEAMLEPLVDFIRYMPVVAFVPLTVIWSGVGETQKVIVIWLGTFFPLVLMVMDGVRRVPADLVDIGRTLGMPAHRILRLIVLRSALPEIWDSLRICIGWAWSWVVLAELVAASSGMGYRITVGQRYLETNLIIGYVLVLGLLGLVTDQIFRVAGRTMFHYQSRRPR